MPSQIGCVISCKRLMVVTPWVTKGTTTTAQIR